jgi:hypothetical protein
MAQKGSLVTHRLLGSFFDNVETLPAYLEKILPDGAKTHIDQVFVPPSSATSSLAAGLQRLQSSLVGLFSKGDDKAWQLGSEWSMPTAYDLRMGGSLSEVSII